MAQESTVRSFGDITDRLDEIVSTVRSKDTSLERSLDLFDEAIALGSKAVELVDKLEFTPEEEARLKGAASASADGEGAPDNTSASQEASVDAGNA